jgi:hypothetical protein
MSQCHFVDDSIHMYLPGIASGPLCMAWYIQGHIMDTVIVRGGNIIYLSTWHFSGWKFSREKWLWWLEIEYISAERQLVLTEANLYFSHETACADWSYFIFQPRDRLCWLELCYISAARQVVLTGTILHFSRETGCADWSCTIFPPSFKKYQLTSWKFLNTLFCFEK